MASPKRQHTLGIWLAALGYFLTYIPYSGFTKAVTSGLWRDKLEVPGFELLGPAAFSTLILEFSFITAMGWWKHTTKKQIAGLIFPWPTRTTLISGLGYVAIITTTTLAYSLHGVSILLALLLMRGGVLVMAPCIDFFFRKRVRWFSWVGLLLSVTALLGALSSIHDFHVGLAAVPILAGYLAGYSVRLPCVSQAGKTENRNQKLRYFVEEQLVAMPVLLLTPLLWALFGSGSVAVQMRYGLAHLLNSNATLPGLAIGACYAGLGTFCTFIYLDRRENTFCIPMYSCSSLLAGIVASYCLHLVFHKPAPGTMELWASALMMTALLVLSPIHHLPEKLVSFLQRFRAHTADSNAGLDLKAAR